MKRSFVIMPFLADFDAVYHQAIKPSLESNKCEVIRADEQFSPIIIEGIRDGIDNADICIADLTGLNSNVIYEVGMSHSQNIPTILISQDPPSKLPFDIRHFRVIQYDKFDLNALFDKLIKNVREVLGLKAMPIKLIQEMLIPSNIIDQGEDSQYYIASCPLSWRAARQRGGGFSNLKKTYGDHVGIRGIIQAFGLIKGINTLPEIINTGDFRKEAALKSANMYCIASPKANHWTNLLLDKFCKSRSPKFAFRPDVESEDLRDVHVNLHLDKKKYLPPGWSDDEERYKRDFGLVLRGPHPGNPSCMLMVLAGRGAMGTEAACRAVTEPDHIHKIREKLSLDNITLDNFKESFWAIVSLNSIDGNIRNIDLGSFKVISVGGFD